MTKLTTTRTVRRETGVRLRGKNLVIELGVHAATLRLKGARYGYQIDYESIFYFGAKKEAERKRKERSLKKRTGKQT